MSTGDCLPLVQDGYFLDQCCWLREPYHQTQSDERMRTDEVVRPSNTGTQSSTGTTGTEKTVL